MQNDREQPGVCRLPLLYPGGRRLVLYGFTGSRFISSDDGKREFLRRLSNARFCESDLRGSKLEGIDVLGIEWKNAKIDLAQAVLLAEALGAKYLP